MFRSVSAVREFLTCTVHEHERSFFFIEEELHCHPSSVVTPCTGGKSNNFLNVVTGDGDVVSCFKPCTEEFMIEFEHLLKIRLVKTKMTATEPCAEPGKEEGADSDEFNEDT